MSEQDQGGGAPSREPRIEPPIDPPNRSPDYRSSALRAPHRAPVRAAPGPTELAQRSPLEWLGPERVAVAPNDLTQQHGGEPLGERVVVHGQVFDAAGNPIAGALVEVWQANAAGRYAHELDQHTAPLDPHFTGAGWCLTDAGGRYRFVTIKPGAYPWRNHANAWRPAHIHFSIVGSTFAQRLVTQMYFPGDPLLEFDPIFRAIPEVSVRQRLLARFDWAATEPEWALGYHFDLRLGGRGATPFEGAAESSGVAT